MRRSRGSALVADATVPADTRLLAIAADHLKHFGPRQVTVVSIADAAGMTHANVYRYFDGLSVEEQDRIFGEPYAGGIKANRPTIQRLLDGAIEQGLITKPITIDEFYPAEVQDT